MTDRHLEFTPFSNRISQIRTDKVVATVWDSHPDSRLELLHSLRLNHRLIQMMLLQISPTFYTDCALQYKILLARPEKNCSGHILFAADHAWKWTELCEGSFSESSIV